MKGFFVAGKENQNAIKTHCFFSGIPSKVLFYKVRRGEIRDQNSTQVIFLKKKSFFFGNKIWLKSLQESCIQSRERPQHSASA